MAKPSQPRPVQRFRINPVEVIIFAFVTSLLLKTTYDLFFNWNTMNPSSFKSLVSNPVTSDRKPASAQTKVSSSFANLEFNCKADQKEKTNAVKIRLAGPLCGREGQSAEGSKLIRAEVTNLTNHSNATVFTDLSSGKFSTDYIPLDQGTNTLSIKLEYAKGRTVAHTMSIEMGSN